MTIPIWLAVIAPGRENHVDCPEGMLFIRTQALARLKLQNVMPAAEVARLTLENIQQGPTYISSDHYRASFDRLLSMPRRVILGMIPRWRRAWRQKG